jgi:glutathione S-transferase
MQARAALRIAAVPPSLSLTQRFDDMKLYFSPGACSLSPHISLHEAGLAHQAVLAPTKTHRLPDGTDYYAINPLGYVPLLALDDGPRLREGPAIVQYIADQVPHKNLAPANGTLARYRLQEWLSFISTELHKNFGPLFSPDTPDAFKETCKQKLVKRLTWVDGEIAGRDFLLPGGFSVADPYLFVILTWAEKMALPIGDLRNLAAFQQRMADRPSVRQALQMEQEQQQKAQQSA